MSHVRHKIHLRKHRRTDNIFSNDGNFYVVVCGGYTFWR